MKVIGNQRLFGGEQIRIEHPSETLQCIMRFSLYLPQGMAANAEVPVVYWLSGLTCNDENFSTKAGAQRVAAELGMALVIADTSPRGAAVPDADSYDMGQGAGFYVNATQAPWKAHYRMYDYITQELPHFVQAHFPVTDQKAISGHSMGGHGALVIATRNPTHYSSVTAFAPIVNPMACRWGQKALTQYLGDDRSEWAQYDSVELIREHGLSLPLLVDQGTADEFLAEQLLTENLSAVLEERADARIRYQEGYDHSYYFIASFIEEHLRFHAKYLMA
ncbi:MAG: S-formylglutathione hydrolase [Gammaproteobacteria bacterium]|nr:S-formylglutathione hydrolase [Gammaproteobacteria bacterium]MBC55184.1 S-formylglutathione hydrolase [Gammaproteobacteria bacterium]|tara:strand:+ start:5479 stop:6309 length:831 start_codon:yes stop_codon:yes gene_type:complete